MTEKSRPDASAAFEKALAAPRPDERYVLRLYTAGASLKSVHAITNIKKVCDEYLEGRYDLQVINLYESPKLAEGEHIVAVPTLVKLLPVPLRRIIGDLSDTDRVLVGLDLRKKNEGADRP